VDGRGLGVSWDTVRQRLMILRLTARHMTRTYPGEYRVVTDAVRLKRRGPSKSELELRDAILNPGQLRSFLAWIKNHDPMLSAFAHMAGLTGMRGRECHYLRERDVDFERKTITIAENEAHTPKTLHSYRTIPVCNYVLDSLRTWIDEHWERRDGGDFLFPAPKSARGGRPPKYRHALAGCLATDTVSKRFRKAIDAARADGVDLAPKFVPRKLRATFITTMREKKADKADLETYVGQSDGTVMSKHYDHASAERLRQIADLAQRLLDGNR
jgi:integrase